MKKILFTILILLSLINIYSEVIIKCDSTVLKGKIIKMDEDTLTIISSNIELVLDKDDIIKIYYNEKQYEEENTNENKDNINLIIDGGNFSSIDDSTYFFWKIFSYSKVKIDFSIQNEEAVLTIDKNPQAETVFFRTVIMDLEKDSEYKLTFQARAVKKTNIKFIIGQVQNSRITEIYSQKKFRLNTKMQEYSYTFKIKEDIFNTSLYFTLNSGNNKIFLDNITVVKIN